MDDIFVTVKNVGVEKPHNHAIDWKEYANACAIWLFSGILALLPIVLVFLRRPKNELSIAAFFGNCDIIYTSITMAIIAFCSTRRSIGEVLSLSYLAIIIAGILIYAMLKSGTEIPILAEDGLYIFNIALLAIVIFIGLLMYLDIQYKKRM